mgnify:CR=1 FL=1
MSTDRYTSPLSERYASKEMQYIFSQDMKFTTWRKLWIALAETEMELGLSEDGKPVITQEQIDELKAHGSVGFDSSVFGNCNNFPWSDITYKLCTDRIQCTCF